MRKGPNVLARWKTRNRKFKIISGLIIVLAIIVIPLPLAAALSMLTMRVSYIAAFKNWVTYGIWLLVELLVLLYMLFEWRTLGSRRVLKVNADLENSHFMEEHEIANDSGFTITKLSELGEQKDGILISAERKKGDIKILLHEPIHTLGIATTGTGKTTTYVSPFIEILSRTSTRPCMVITDPKGELYRRHATTLKANGYKVHIIDMLDTYHSTLWNPFNDVWRKTDEMNDQIRQVKGKYVLSGKVYGTFKDAETAKRQRAIKLKDEIYEDLQDLIYTCCPVEAAQDKSWQQGARDLLFAMALRFWEDVRDGYMPREKFNLYNLWWNLVEYATDEKIDVLQEYIEDCADAASRAKGMANTVLVSQDRTLTSYLGSVNQYLHWMADGGIAQLTSGNGIEFMEWDEEPNVLFIRVPDAKDNRHGAVTLMLVQMYKALLEKAQRNVDLGVTDDQCLMRNCYFLLDEFGNLPKIEKLVNIITIARSRKIFFCPIIQSFKQLDVRYGKDGADIIKDNCNIQIFMGTSDPKTLDEISAACGKHKVKSVSYNESKDMSVSTSAQSIPLIPPSELSKLNNPKGGVMGNAIVLSTGNYPILSVSTPYFKAIDLYGIEECNIPLNEFMEFDEVANRYDISRLIYLNRVLNNEAPSDEERAEQRTAQVTEDVILQTAVVSLQKKITKEILSLKSKISEDDFIKLAAAETSGKIAMLDELAERATEAGNIFLAAQIERIIGFLKYASREEATENLRNNGGVNANDG